ncbi:MAG: hybrid sensor histidine kinase/response regulator [Waterburya sp.]
MNAQSIFIVEDEIITARSIAQNLKKFGYQVAGIANSGTKALEQIITTRPDLVLMDIFLQKDDIDGITTAERIQSQLNVPIIYLTAHSEQETLERAKATTPFGYILKPYNKKNLQIEIEMSLHKHQLVTSAMENQVNELSDYLIDLVVHELRTPLTVILSTSESLKRYRQEWTTEKQDDSLNRIQQATQQITRLLNNVTIWEQLGKEQLTLESDWIDLIALSEEILSNLRLIDEQNHELILSYQSNKQMLYLDRSILEYILNNLLLNGIQYSPANSTVSLNVDYQENYLVLQVADEGIGIPQTEQERIFKLFYRASNTDYIKGKGLGLAIVKKYVQLCGGEISVESNSQTGTIFTVSLPLAN